MDTAHLDAFLDALHRHDVEGLSAHLADNVVIRSPIVPTPFEGKARVEAVLRVLLKIVDAFEVRDVLHGETHHAIYLGIRSGETQLDGADYLHLNEAGLIDDMTIMWRPLPALVEVQNRLAPLIGIPALTLVERDAA